MAPVPASCRRSPSPPAPMRRSSRPRSSRTSRSSKAARGTGQAVGVHITPGMPREARLQAVLQTQGLSQRQQELAYWLALGLPESQVAVRMEDGSLRHFQRAEPTAVGTPVVLQGKGFRVDQGGSARAADPYAQPQPQPGAVRVSDTY